MKPNQFSLGRHPLSDAPYWNPYLNGTKTTSNITQKLKALMNFVSNLKVHICYLFIYFGNFRYAPSPDPLLSIRFYERTPEQTAALGFLAEPTAAEEPVSEGNNSMSYTVPHGSVGAVAGRRAIAQGNTDEVAAALCRYSAPEEVSYDFAYSVNLNFFFISDDCY
jgi:hypothetical protein